MPTTLYAEIRRLKKVGKMLDFMDTRSYSLQLCAGLNYIHTAGICHRDIKPQNVLIDPAQRTLKVCDFGSAKILEPGQPNIAYICSRYYRAPELIFGAEEYTTAIDVWCVEDRGGGGGCGGSRCGWLLWLPLPCPVLFSLLLAPASRRPWLLLLPSLPQSLPPVLGVSARPPLTLCVIVLFIRSFFFRPFSCWCWCWCSRRRCCLCLCLRSVLVLVLAVVLVLVLVLALLFLWLVLAGRRAASWRSACWHRPCSPGAP
jgi:serine/threonine protein kinase